MHLASYVLTQIVLALCMAVSGGSMVGAQTSGSEVSEFDGEAVQATSPSALKPGQHLWPPERAPAGPSRRATSSVTFMARVLRQQAMRACRLRSGGARMSLAGASAGPSRARRLRERVQADAPGPVFVRVKGDGNPVT
jgi:hypothetical protein